VGGCTLLLLVTFSCRLHYSMCVSAGIRNHEKRVSDIWICKLGTVPGSMSWIEKKFELQVRKWEEYKGNRYGPLSGF
jgi:hypothetical protein